MQRTAKVHDLDVTAILPDKSLGEEIEHLFIFWSSVRVLCLCSVVPLFTSVCLSFWLLFGGLSFCLSLSTPVSFMYVWLEVHVEPEEPCMQLSVRLSLYLYGYLYVHIEN